MHVIQALAELPFATDKAIPILVLPKGSAGSSPGVEPQGHDLLGVVKHLINQQRISRPDQGVPVVRH